LIATVGTCGLQYVRAGFERLGLDRIMAITGEENEPARRLMETIGMAARGTDRYYDSEWSLYDATSSTWRPPEDR
jgi:RimJ/RimL family protein N-acetyltransferase